MLLKFFTGIKSKLINFTDKSYKIYNILKPIRYYIFNMNLKKYRSNIFSKKSFIHDKYRSFKMTKISVL